MKSWTEKLHDSKDLPKVVKLKAEAAEHWGGETMVVPSPIEVDELMKKVPRGKVVTINEIRKALAKKHKTDLGCPLTSGIFAWIAAHAAEEERGKGILNITPYWRTLKAKGELNPKYPGGIHQQKTFLENEGFKIITKGKKHLVENYESKIAKL
jgi:alkylated DNA nucleotide flippase Atl1